MAQTKTCVKLLLLLCHCHKEKTARGRIPVVRAQREMNYRQDYLLKLHCIKLVTLHLMVVTLLLSL